MVRATLEAYDGIPYLSDLSHRGLRVHLARDREHVQGSCVCSPQHYQLSPFIFAMLPHWDFTRGDSHRSGWVDSAMLDAVTLRRSSGPNIDTTIQDSDELNWYMCRLRKQVSYTRIVIYMS